MNYSKFYPTEAIVTFKQDGKDLSFAASALVTPVGIAELPDGFAASKDSITEICIPIASWQSPNPPERGNIIQLGTLFYSVVSFQADGFHYVLNCRDRGDKLCA